MMTPTELAEKQIEETERFGPHVAEHLHAARVAFTRALIKQPSMRSAEALAIRDLFFRQINEMIEVCRTWSKHE
jgi:hypothetical protein